VEVIDIVKQKLVPLPDDVVIISAIEEVGQTIMNYCNREDIPPELRFVHANMVIDFVNGIKRKGDIDAQASVESIKEGDVTVSFKAAGVALGVRSLESLLFDYSKQLNKFRKMRW